MKLPEIPPNWFWKSIGELGAEGRPAVKAGPFGSALKKLFYTESGFRVYGQEQVLAGDLSRGDYYIDEERFEQLRSCEVKAGDILVSLVGSFGKVLIVPEAVEPGIINPRLVRLSLAPTLVNPRFFYRFFQSPLAQSQMEMQSHGGTMDILNAGNISKIFVPLPPLPEQCRIAAILDKADAIRRKRQEALALTDKFLRSVFLEMFGDPVTNPKRWERVPLNEVVEKIDSGRSPVCLDRPADDHEWGILKLGAVTSCKYSETENKAIPGYLEPDLSLEVKPRDLLFSRKNTYDLVAACAFVFSTRPRLLLPDLIFRFQLKDDCGLLPEFLWALLTHPGKRKKIQALASGSAGSMPNISKSRLLNFEIERPSLELQQVFASIMKSVKRFSEDLKLSSDSLDSLFESLRQRAFRGEL